MLLFLIFWPLVLSIPCAALGLKSRSLRDVFPALACLVEFAAAAYTTFKYLGGAEFSVDIQWACGGLGFTLDGFRAVWIVIITFCWMMSEFLAMEYLEEHQSRYHLFTLITLCGTMGVFLSADLYTTFVFFEMMSLASWAWVAHEDNIKAGYASDTYLAVAVIGGLVTLMGLFVLGYLLGGDLTIATLAERCAPIFSTKDAPFLIVAGLCMLLGFGAKAGMFPLHFWLPMAHPVAPAPASALLSGVLTKCGIFGIIVTSCEIFRGDAKWGEMVLGLGAVTMLWGAVLGVFSTDLKRTLACSSVSQIGFMLTGIGMSGILGAENALATRGVMLHMMNHSLIKLTLFLLAGVVAMNRHTLDLNKLRGCCRGNKPLTFAFLMAGLSVAGAPMFSGYVSKTLLHEAIVEGTELVREAGGAYMPLKAIEWVFLISGGLTLAYMSKLFYNLFVLKPSGKSEPLHMRPLSALAILAPACLMPVFGLTPHLTMEPIAIMGQTFLSGGDLEESINYFSIKNLSGAAISICIGVLVFLLLIRRVLMEKDKKGIPVNREVWPDWLDLEKSILRPMVRSVLLMAFGTIFRALDYLPDAFLLALRRTVLSDRLPVPHAISDSEILDRTGRALDRTCQRLRKHENTTSFVYLFAETKQNIRFTTKIVSASMSFGLLMFCVGLTLTLVYLLL